jgi:hypothetical protein
VSGCKNDVSFDLSELVHIVTLCLQLVLLLILEVVTDYYSIVIVILGLSELGGIRFKLIVEHIQEIFDSRLYFGCLIREVFAKARELSYT